MKRKEHSVPFISAPFHHAECSDPRVGPNLTARSQVDTAVPADRQPARLGQEDLLTLSRALKDFHIAMNKFRIIVRKFLCSDFKPGMLQSTQ